MLDFQKVKQSERERAGKLAASAAGAAMEADARLEAHAATESSNDVKLSAAFTNVDSNGGTNTFVPGEGETSEQSFATQFSQEEKSKIREMVANAASAEEIDRIETSVKRGIFPGKSEGDGNIRPPPPPPSEDGQGDAKRQKS